MKVTKCESSIPHYHVGIEATGSMPWFLKLMEELKIECRVGHPATGREIAADLTGRKSLSRNLDALNRATRSTHIIAASSSVGANADASAAYAAIPGPGSRSATWRHSLEPSRPTHAAGLADGSACQPTAGRPAEVVPSFAEIDRRSRQAGLRSGPAASLGSTLDDAPRSGSRHGLGQRSVLGWSTAIRGWESGGQLHRDDPQ